MQGMRELLRESLAKSLRTLSPMDRLAAAWPVVCGAVMASRAQLLGFEDGRLLIQVRDAAWRDQLWTSRERLARELARVAKVEVREIHFEGGSDRPRHRPSATGAGSGHADRGSRGVGRRNAPKAPVAPAKPPGGAA